MVDSVTGTPTAGISSAAGGPPASNALSSNYDMFLSLLTTQLKVQDPLDPLKANEFTNQLVQYSSVEQQIKMNSNLETLISSVSSSNASNMVGYLGTRVTADGVSSVLGDGLATWKFNAPAAADGAKVTIRNSGGAVVYSDEVDLSKGSGSYVWDGRTDVGGTAPDGAYAISFSAKDATGKNVSVSTQSSGTVTGIDFSSGEPVLKMGDISVPLSSITSVQSAL